MNTSIDTKEFATVLKGLRGDETAESFAERVGIALHTYRRYERAETERIPFEDAVRIAKGHGISLDTLGALAGIYAIPETTEEDTQLNQVLEQIRNLVAGLSRKDQELVLGFYFDTIKSWQRRFTKEVEKEPESSKALPEWFKRTALQST